MPDPDADKVAPVNKLLALLPILYKDMHAAKQFLGNTWHQHIVNFRDFIGNPETASPILDFGCGPNGGLEQANDLGTVIGFDPYVPRRDEDPWHKQPRTVFTCDVLEHLPIEHLRDFATKMCKVKSIRKIYIALSTRSANKSMPNGMNAHLTVRPMQWWQGFFDCTVGFHYDTVHALGNMLTEEAVFAFVRKKHA